MEDLAAELVVVGVAPTRLDITAGKAGHLGNMVVQVLVVVVVQLLLYSVTDRR